MNAQAHQVNPPKVGRILLIDDEADILEMLQVTFEAQGWKVFTATDAVTGLGIMASEKFDAIVTDFNMPKMNGLEFIIQSKANLRNKSAKIFVLSGAVDAPNLKRIAAIGVASILVKPFSAKAVVEKVSSLCFGKPAAPANKPATSYNKEIFHSILSAIQEVIGFYFGEVGVVGKPAIKSSMSMEGYFTALISLNQGGSMGAIAFSSDEDFLRRLYKCLFGEELPDSKGDLMRDLAGEMCNQISGKIKINLAKCDYHLNIGLPQIIVGASHAVKQTSVSPVIVIPIESQGCKLTVEFTMNGVLVKEKREGPETKDIASGSVIF